MLMLYTCVKVPFVNDWLVTLKVVAGSPCTSLPTVRSPNAYRSEGTGSDFGEKDILDRGLSNL